MSLIDRKKLNIEYHSNKGFTLVELIVVLLLMTILLSVAIFGALGWIDWTRFKNENDVAEDIFFAAQNQLTELDSSGAMERRVKEVLYSGNDYDTSYVLAQGTENVDVKIVDFNSLVKNDGTGYQWANIWLDNNLRTERRTIITLNVSAGQYANYAADRNSVDPDVQLLFDLVAPYISDKSVLNKAICIEFSPEAAQVFAVCYSDQADTLSYTQATAGKNINIVDRTYQVRQEAMLGYYGVDSLTAKIKGRDKDDDAYRLEIENERSLNLILKKNSESLEQIGDADIVYTISGASTYSGNYNPVMKITVPRDQINGLSTITNIHAAANNPREVNVEFMDGLFKNEATPRTFRVPMWRDGAEGSINMALDMADIQAQSTQYADMFGVISVADGADTEASINAFTNTYSFYRFGLPNVRFIRAKVNINEYDAGGALKVSGATDAGRKPLGGEVFAKYGSTADAPLGESVTFANWEDGDDDFTYGIKNGRHLYNIRFESDYSDAFKSASPSIIPQDRKRKYVLKNDISWTGDFAKSTPEDNYFFNSYSSLGASTKKYGINLLPNESSGIIELSYVENGAIKYPEYDTSHMPFPGFRILSYSDEFTQTADFSAIASGTVEDKTYYKLQDFNVSFAANCIYGVYGKKIEDKILAGHSANYNDISVKGKAGALPLGFFAESFGNINNIEIDNLKVTGVEEFTSNSTKNYLFTSKVGGFVGESFGSLSNLYIDVFVPTSTENNNKGFSSYVSGRSDVAGIVGHQYFMIESTDSSAETPQPTATDPYAASAVTISGCINNADVTGIGYVGGIIGRIYPSGRDAFDVTYQIDGVSQNYSDRRIPVDSSAFTLKEIQKFTISNCSNYGDISMNEYFAKTAIDTDKFKRGFFFGGIAGAALNNYAMDNRQDNNYAHNTPGTRKAIISNCESYTLYTEDELNKIINPSSNEEIAETKRRLKAIFVGQIVGGARYAYIDNCSTTPRNSPENNGKYSFVFGNRYVGGVAGYLLETNISGDSKYNTDELSKLNATDAVYKNDYSIINGTGAFGNYAVGGIAGCFGRPDIARLPGNVFRECYKDVLEGLYGEFNRTNYVTQKWYKYPINCGQIDNSKYVQNGLLNTAPVIAANYDYSINTSIENEIIRLEGYSNIKDAKDGRDSYYAVGGIAGYLSSSIGSADNIQTEEVKKFVLKLALNVAKPSDLNNISVSDLQEKINSSSFVTDGVGGIAGVTLGYGNINKNKKTSRIDAVVIGRNRVGGAVGDTCVLNQRNGRSMLANFYPVKKSGSSGMYVLGQDCVGGIVGAYSDLIKDSAGLNKSGSYDNGTINKGYRVIGDRAVGGIIGAYSGEASEGLINVKVSTYSDKVYVKGSMYVGGLVGVQETYKATAYKYYLEMDGIDVSADCFGGCLFGAMYTQDAYWPLDSLAKPANKETVQRITVNSKLCSAFVAGLYAYNKGNTVLYNSTNWNENNNYYPEIVTEGGNDKNISKNGLYNNESIKTLVYSVDSQNGLEEGYRKFIDESLKTTFSSSTSGITMDLTELSNKVQKGGDSTLCNVTADVYAGGLFGFVPEYTPVTIIGYRNRAKVITNKAIKSKEMSDSDNNVYSYLGAVTGKVPRGMTLEYCINTSSKNNYYSTAASFVGGITEVNTGIISDTGYSLDSNNNKIYDFYATDVTYDRSTGGAAAIAGVNGNRDTDGKNSGVIKDCVNLYPMTGKYPAGIAATAGGKSTIKDCINHADITSSRPSDEGGAAGIIYDVNQYAKDDVTVTLEGNVNTGLIKGNGNTGKNYTAGIIYDSKGKGDIILCRNYGTGLKYAITNSESGKRAKSIKYCLDASASTENSLSEDRYENFGKVVKEKNDDESPTGDMTANLYIGKKQGEEGLGNPEKTTLFAANQLYTNEHQFYVPDEDKDDPNSQNNFWYPVKAYSEVTEKEDIDDLVLNAVNGTDPEHKSASVWKLDSANPQNKLTFEVQAVDEYGFANNRYADIDSFTIYWDNYKKTELEEYYSASSILSDVDAKNSDSMYRSFIGADDGLIHDSFSDLANDECINESNRPDSVTDGTLKNNVAADQIDEFGLSVYVYMINNNDNYDSLSATQRKELFISYLYQLATIYPTNNPLNYNGASDEYLAFYDEAIKNSQLNESDYYEKYITPLELSYLDSAISLLNFGSNDDAGTYSNRYYVADNSSYTESDRKAYKANRESFINNDSTIRAFDYIYATYVYMENKLSARIPSDYNEQLKYYNDLLASNIESYGISYYDSTLSTGYTPEYNIVFYDINGKILSVGQSSVKITAADYYKEHKVNLENIRAFIGESEDSNEIYRNDFPNTGTRGISLYKEADFSYDQIAKMVIIVAADDDNNTSIGIRALSWETKDEDGNIVNGSMKRPDNSTISPYRKATGINNTVKVLDEYKIPLSKLYFVRPSNVEEGTIVTPSLYLYKYSTNMTNIDINQGLAEGNRIHLIGDDDYFSNDYLTRTESFVKDKYNGKGKLYTYYLYDRIDAEYVELMKNVYPK